MTQFTPRATTDADGAIMAFIDADGAPMIGQPFHPQALNREPWASEADALAWATEYVDVLAQQEIDAVEAERIAVEEQEAAARQIVEDRERLQRIEAMLAELLGRATSA